MECLLQLLQCIGEINKLASAQQKAAGFPMVFSSGAKLELMYDLVGLRLAALGGTQVAFHDGALWDQPEVPTVKIRATCFSEFLNLALAFQFGINKWVITCNYRFSCLEPSVM